MQSSGAPLGHHDHITREGEAGRPTESRRAFLAGAGVAALGSAAAMGGAGDAQAQTSPPPSGTAPAPPAAPRGPQFLDYPGKDRGLVVLGDRPLVAETPEALMDDPTTPVGRFFVRNNGLLPEDRTASADAWSIRIDGEVDRPLAITLGELKQRFKARTYRMVLECGGNGRSFFMPAARGNQWTNGGASCAEWTGVALADVLRAAGLKPDGKFTGFFGADPHLSGDTTRQAISRGMPVEKALDPHTLIVWGMNGQPLPFIHGGPVRLVVPGWPGSLSQKWLTRVLIRKDPHDGSGMGGTSYRVPTVPIVPGSNADGRTNFADMTSMPTRAVITAPANGTRLAAGTREIAIRGAAWGGEQHPTRVDVSADGGQTWRRMALTPRRNKYDWVRWNGSIALPSDGYFELWVRARDSKGRFTPHTAVNWNPQGYGANPFHRIAVLVG
ncbi:MAG: sulfite oxidase [Hyphomicrobiales bacterium]|nr:sulfite oxidase [Hyphomicrobiales bacterium]